MTALPPRTARAPSSLCPAPMILIRTWTIFHVADAFIITADSRSMLGEACNTGSCQSTMLQPICWVQVTRGRKRARVERSEPSAGALALTKWFVCFTFQSRSLSSTRSIIPDCLELFFVLFYSDFGITLVASGSSSVVHLGKGLQLFEVLFILQIGD